MNADAYEFDFVDQVFSEALEGQCDPAELDIYEMAKRYAASENVPKELFDAELYKNPRGRDWVLVYVRDLLNEEEPRKSESLS